MKNKRIGRLTILKTNKEKSYPNSKYKYIDCICSCGNKTTVRQDHLLSGATQSCGCLHKESNKSRKKKNKFVIIKNIVKLYASNTGNYFIVDLKDYNKIKGYCWYEDKKGYLISRINGKLTKLHRFILNIYDPKIHVDHININKKDNRKINLRKATSKQNSHNRKEPSNNKSGFRGVFYRKEKNKWQAKIKNKFLGYFDTFEEAREKRLYAEKKYYKNFAPHEG